MKKIFLTIVLVLALAVPGFAATYYVSTSLGNAGYNGTQPAFTSGSNGPFLTLAQANTVASGSTVLFRRGDTWTATASNQYILIPGDNITYGTYYNTDGTDDTAQAKPIIDGNNTGNYCIRNNARDGCVVRNIAGKNAVNSNFDSRNNPTYTIEYCDSLPTTAGTGGGFSFYSNLANSVITSNYNTSDAPGSANGGFNINDSGAAYHVTLNDTGSIARNTTALSGWQVTYGSTVNWTNSQAYGNYEDGFSVNNTSVCTANNCKSYNNGNVLSASSGDGFTAHDTSTFNVINCISYGNLKSAVGMVGGSTGVIYNNTFYNNGLGASAAAELYIVSTGTHTIKNNILYSTANGYATKVSGAGAKTIGNNCYQGKFQWNTADKTYSEWIIASGDSNSINADPLLHSLVTPDFHLQDGSPCINAGDATVNATVTHDYFGKPRFTKNSIGAAEYWSTGGSHSLPGE
jgi:hypothetical protein